MSLKSYQEYLERKIQEDTNSTIQIEKTSSSLKPVSEDHFSKYSEVFSKIIEDRPEEIRKLVQKAISAGVFDDQPEQLTQAKELHSKLSSGNMKTTATKVAKSLSHVSKPIIDDKGSSATEL